jgi:hypothetical protein
VGSAVVLGDQLKLPVVLCHMDPTEVGVRTGHRAWRGRLLLCAMMSSAKLAILYDETRPGGAQQRQHLSAIH